MTLEQWIKAVLGSMLVGLGTCVAGCGPMTWKVDSATAQGHASTAFRLFPWRDHGQRRGDGRGQPHAGTER